MIAIVCESVNENVLIEKIKQDSLVEDCVIEIKNNRVIIAIKTYPIYFSSESRALENRIKIMASAFFGNNFLITVTKDAYTYYRIKNNH